MSSNTLSLLEAVNRLRTAEAEAQQAKLDVAKLLIEAVQTQQRVTYLSKLTKIKRTTIYWLMDKYADK